MSSFTGGGGGGVGVGDGGGGGVGVGDGRGGGVGVGDGGGGGVGVGDGGGGGVGDGGGGVVGVGDGGGGDGGGGGDESTVNIHIPDCLLIDILHRLPIKSIFQFNCVSKTWFSLINDPSFFQNYPCHSKHGLPPWFLFSRYVDISDLDNLPPQDIRGKHFIISENPLLKYSIPSPPPAKLRCIASCRDLLLLIDLYGRHYVCNVITRQCIKLPRTRVGKNYYHLGIGLSSRVIGGVAHYKVVRIDTVRRFIRKNVLCFDVDIFSSETGEWMNKMVELPPEVQFKPRIKKPVSFAGIIHWMDHENHKIIAYNTETTNDVCRSIDMPGGTESAAYIAWRKSMFDVCRGRLRYFELDDDLVMPGKMAGWSVWVLVDYDKGEWCLEHKGYNRDISPLDACHSVHFSRRVIKPVGFHPLNMDLIYFWCNLHIFKYNLRTGLIEGAYHKFPQRFFGFVSWWGVFSVVPSPLPAPIAPPSWEEEEEGWIRKLLRRLFASWLPW